MSRPRRFKKRRWAESSHQGIAFFFTFLLIATVIGYFGFVRPPSDGFAAAQTK